MKEMQSARGTNSRQASARPRVLVVEDSLVVAMDLQATLEQAGCEVLGPAPTLEAAASLVETNPIDSALLDIDVDGKKSFGLAERLRELGVPIAFLSGYRAEQVVPTALRECMWLEKPLKEEELLSKLNVLLGTSHRGVDVVTAFSSTR